MEVKQATKPLKWKLIKSTLLILLIAFGVASILVYSGIGKISDGIVNLVTTRSEVTTTKLNEFAQSSAKRIKENLTAEIKQRTTNVLKKDSSSLVQLFQDNSFLQVKEFTQNVFKDDKDILRAAFFVFDGNNIQSWHYVDRTVPAGLD
ncbi:MAG: hypothetical protein ACOYOK_11555, partial [Pseudobdellovibrionaceae bacterium]